MLLRNLIERTTLRRTYLPWNIEFVIIVKLFWKNVRYINNIDHWLDDAYRKICFKDLVWKYESEYVLYWAWLCTRKKTILHNYAHTMHLVKFYNNDQMILFFRMELTFLEWTAWKRCTCPTCYSWRSSTPVICRRLLTHSGVKLIFHLMTTCRAIQPSCHDRNKTQTFSTLKLIARLQIVRWMKLYKRNQPPDRTAGTECLSPDPKGKNSGMKKLKNRSSVLEIKVNLKVAELKQLEFLYLIDFGLIYFQIMKLKTPSKNYWLRKTLC